LREEPFELLLTDIVMPEMDGIEFARRATELDPDIKVMFITGFAAVALNPDSQAPKDAKVLSKPFHLRESGQTKWRRCWPPDSFCGKRLASLGTSRYSRLLATR
jgi:CheY-like chemotaxis protein